MQLELLIDYKYQFMRIENKIHISVVITRIILLVIERLFGKNILELFSFREGLAILLML